MKTARITPADTCKLRGVDVTTERAFIRSGKCPYATAFIKDRAKSFSYVIYPWKVVEYFGPELAKGIGISV